LQAARKRQHKETFQQEYAPRAGIEGTVSQAVGIPDLRRVRYIGLAKTRLQHLLTATGLNLLRWSAWWADRQLACTRTSPFARLAPTLAASS
jgi:transposase